VDFERYGQLAAVLYGLEERRYASALKRAGSSRKAWDRANAHLAPKLHEDPEALATYTAAFRAGLAERAGDVRDLTEAEYVRAQVKTRLGEHWAPKGLDPVAYLVTAYRYMDLLADPKVAARVEALVRLGVARSQGQYKVRRLPAPKLAKRVRSNRCPGCNAYKATESRTPHVYCDFCGSLMDYDYEQARVATSGLDAGFLLVGIVDGVRDTLRSSWASGDHETWAKAWAWVYETDMDVSPEGWPPRIGNPRYRAEMVAWSVETCRVLASESRLKRANERTSKAFYKAMEKGGTTKWIGKHLDAAEAGLELEISLYEGRGLFETHPDALQPAGYRRANRGGWVDAWKPYVSGDALDFVRKRAEPEVGWIEIPKPETERSCCGNCGGALVVVAGSQALVCEACGATLDAIAPRFPCPGCSAPVVVVPHSHEIKCGHCKAIFVAGT